MAKSSILNTSLSFQILVVAGEVKPVETVPPVEPSAPPATPVEPETPAEKPASTEDVPIVIDDEEFDDPVVVVVEVTEPEAPPAEMITEKPKPELEKCRI